MLALLDPEVGELEIDDHESRDSEEELSEAEESQSNPEEDEDTTSDYRNKRGNARKQVSKKTTMPKIKLKHKISS
jgi:hypothetical protein